MIKQTVNSNKITTEELEQLIRFKLESLWEMSKSGNNLSKKLPPLMIWGPPGIGKSCIIETITKELNIGYLDIRLSQREPVDIRGLPVPRENGVEWLISAEFPRDKGSKGIIIFDELTSSDRTLQVAAYEFILDRRLGNLYKVPDGWLIVAAGNRTSDRAVATTMSSALANRFLHVELEADIDSWSKWAMRNDIHPHVLGFLRYKPEALFIMEGKLERGWPSPRSWERVSTMLKLAERNKAAFTRITEISIDGLIGEGIGIEFNEFRKCSNELDEIRSIMLDSDKPINIPSRADQKHALCSTMVYNLWRGKDEKESKQLLNGFFRISLRLSSDFAAMAMTDAMYGKGEKYVESACQLILNNDHWLAWKTKHGETLQKTMKIYANNHS